MDKILKSMPDEAKDYYYEKWINYESDLALSSNTIRYISTLVLLVVAILLLVFVWWLILKTTVSKKTRELTDLKLAFEHKVEVRTDELKYLNERINESEKLNSLSRLVIGISHEINTPLGNGIMLSSFMNNKLQLMSCEHKEELIAINKDVGQQFQKVKQIIDDFKSVATYRFEKSFKKVKLADEIETLVSILRLESKFKGITINLDLDPTIYVYISPSSLHHVLRVIFDNIAEHAYLDGVGDVDILLKFDKNSNYLKISDYGRGISRQALTEVFEPFYTTKENDKNIGLGLYSAYNIVNSLFKSLIKIESDLGKGTDVIIRFPVSS